MNFAGLIGIPSTPSCAAASVQWENQFEPEHPHTIDILDQLVSLYEAWTKPEKAEEWRAKLPQTEAVKE
ncbi:MAG: hypothetical protein WBC05_16740 [Sedimentisphaerales bacterium]